ncbi:MAG: flavodoxin [Lachnospiraceae bacterium]|nr:flavodoxin [Lachnospiraceae bacterium]
MSTLVTYFSAEAGRTKKVAEDLAKKLGADLFEISPEKPYTAADLRYMNPMARCNREKFGKKDVPVSGVVEHFSEYDTVYVGFPIWYGAAPNVVNTFCKAYDWTGKKVHAFATSGGSGIGKTAEKLAPYVKGAVSVDAKLVHSAQEL